MNKKEIIMLKEKVDEIDPDAFVIVTDAREVHENLKAYDMSSFSMHRH